MEAKIKEVQDYFKNKILKNEFQIESITEFRCNILIDGKYHFGIWIGNLEIRKTIQTIYLNESNFMQLPFTELECEILYNIFKPIVDVNIKELKQAQIEKLQTELNNL